jgi:hypothetical protein
MMGRTVLHWACHSCPSDLVLELISTLTSQLSVLVKARTRAGDTPLHWLLENAERALSEASVGLAETICRYGADLDTANEKGVTPRQLLEIHAGLSELSSAHSIRLRALLDEHNEETVGLSASAPATAIATTIAQPSGTKKKLVVTLKR